VIYIYKPEIKASGYKPEIKAGGHQPALIIQLTLVIRLTTPGLSLYLKLFHDGKSVTCPSSQPAIGIAAWHRSQAVRLDEWIEPDWIAAEGSHRLPFI
jgi:hypothetical protein